MQSASSTQQSTTPALTGFQNTEAYSTTVTSIIQSGSCQQEGSRPTTPHTSHERTATSTTDLILDNITYDKVLSSSVKGLRLASHQQYPPQTPPTGDDARTPPNSPTHALPNQSLMSASLNIMASETVTRSDVDRTNF